MVTFSHTQCYNLRSVACPSAGPCDIYGSELYVPSPTTQTYVQPVTTYYAAPYLEIVKNSSPTIEVSKCTEALHSKPACSAHEEVWVEKYVVHTEVQVVPITIHTYCADSTAVTRGTEVIHVTALTTILFSIAITETSISTRTSTSISLLITVAEATSTSETTEYITTLSRNTISSSMPVAQPYDACFGYDGSPAPAPPMPISTTAMQPEIPLVSVPTALYETPAPSPVSAEDEHLCKRYDCAPASEIDVPCMGHECPAPAPEPG
ncbi:hypothetical protein BDZ91DRAFT_792104 [Kalaharituber pfeilii]|nr:hypothetical protein BDZ91DRAFT_792104 [Kalaharituber pfeilii]